MPIKCLLYRFEAASGEIIVARILRESEPVTQSEIDGSLLHWQETYRLAHPELEFIECYQVELEFDSGLIIDTRINEA